MMTIGGKKWTKKDWETILDGVGLKVAKIWSWEIGTQAVVEAVLKR